MKIVDWICKTNNISLASIFRKSVTKNRVEHVYCPVGLKAPSYTLPIWELAYYFPREMGGKSSSEAGSFKKKKLSCLFPPSVIRSRWYYKLANSNFPAVLDLPTAARAIIEGRSLSSIAERMLLFPRERWRKWRHQVRPC